MILNSSNTIFTQQGAESEEALMESDKVLLYKSNSKISSMSYAGPINTKIVKSETIPANFTNILKRIKGYCSLGTTKAYKEDMTNTISFRNVHIYSSKATTLDGIERICYISSINDCTINVSEHNTNKGSAYSSLYPILKTKLNQSGFTQNLPHDSFNININECQKFVDIINEVIEEREFNKYMLVKGDKIDTITLGKKEKQNRLFYNVAYYVEKKAEIYAYNEGINLNGIEDIISTLNNIIKKIEIIDRAQDLEDLMKKLDSMKKVADAKKIILDIKESEL
ncbi:MAG: hypothetical protein E6248_11805 [Clostridium sp.]|uniref:hypothetical protein n=1 Tax=Clostridium sp. TaxID=1506 RepID=UPI00290E8051|nr:hypothetical protein [Clostridium sp.]MDU5111126.1 hypothetical protein [Clostridium sp.]